MKIINPRFQLCVGLYVHHELKNIILEKYYFYISILYTSSWTMRHIFILNLMFMMYGMVIFRIPQWLFENFICISHKQLQIWLMRSICSRMRIVSGRFMLCIHFIAIRNNHLFLSAFLSLHSQPADAHAGCCLFIFIYNLVEIHFSFLNLC